MFQKFWTTNKNQSDSCESHGDFDYKHLKSLTSKLIKDAAYRNHCPYYITFSSLTERVVPEELRSVLVVNIQLYTRGKNYSDNSVVG